MMLEDNNEVRNIAMKADLVILLFLINDVGKVYY